MGDAWQIMLHVCRIIFYINTIILTIKGEKIAVQYDADTFQQTRIDALPLEDIIHIGTVAVQFVCEPTHTAFLAVQFCLYFFTDVY